MIFEETNTKFQIPKDVHPLKILLMFLLKYLVAFLRCETFSI